MATGTKEATTREAASSPEAEAILHRPEVLECIQCGTCSASCPTAYAMDHLNVEAYQGQVNSRFGTDFSLPVLFFSQLLGVSMGLGREELGLGEELVSAKALLAPYVT